MGGLRPHCCRQSSSRGWWCVMAAALAVWALSTLLSPYPAAETHPLPEGQGQLLPQRPYLPVPAAPAACRAQNDQVGPGSCRSSGPLTVPGGNEPSLEPGPVPVQSLTCGVTSRPQACHPE